MKSEVYSWRVSTELKMDLEREARHRNTSLSAVLSLAVREWLKKSDPEIDGNDEQCRLHQAASKCLGVFASGETRRSESAREVIRKRLRTRHGR